MSSRQLSDTKKALVSNPEALSDPEYSDDENVLPGEEIAADDGKLAIKFSPGQCRY